MVFIPILQLAATLISYLIFLFDFALQIATVCIVHHNTQFSFFCLVDFFEFNDVWMVKDLQDFGFSKCLPPLFLSHLFYVNLLYNS